MQKLKNHAVNLAKAAEAGFTLTEMLIVIALMALVGTFVATNVMRQYDEAKVNATKIQMKQLGVILDDFRRVCGNYPTTDMNLDALVKPPGAGCKNYPGEGFIADHKVPQDAWGRDFIYESNGNDYTLRSMGRDGKEGGDGFDKDISSKDE